MTCAYGLGMVTMPARPYIVIPAALRRRCVLRPGDRALLAVIPGEDTLAAYSLAVANQAIRAHGPFPRAGGGQGSRKGSSTVHLAGDFPTCR